MTPIDQIVQSKERKQKRKEPKEKTKERNITPIDNSLSSIVNSPLESKTKIVDLLLEDYSHLIDSSYKGWFAKRFYKLDPNFVKECASKAREGRDPQRLFAYYIKAHS